MGRTICAATLDLPSTFFMAVLRPGALLDARNGLRKVKEFGWHATVVGHDAAEVVVNLESSVLARGKPYLAGSVTSAAV